MTHLHHKGNGSPAGQQPRQWRKPSTCAGKHAGSARPTMAKPIAPQPKTTPREGRLSCKPRRRRPGVSVPKAGYVCAFCAQTTRALELILLGAHTCRFVGRVAQHTGAADSRAIGQASPTTLNWLRLFSGQRSVTVLWGSWGASRALLGDAGVQLPKSKFEHDGR